MDKRIGILNNYADESSSAPSARYFKDFIDNSEIINICHGERIIDINKYDGYVISGSRSCHLDNLDWIGYLRSLIKEIYSNKIPCLAVCFGHQLVADVFGGKTIAKKNGEEGFRIIPTDSDKKQPRLFVDIPTPLKIYQSHNDAVLSAPPHSNNILRNEKCIQYYEFGSIYSIQSHPEISVATAIKIAKRDDQNINEVLNGVTEENIRSQLVIRNFVELV